MNCPAFYAAADVMVLVSIVGRGWPNACGSKRSPCGTPIVISEAGGARELIDRPAAGRIVDARPEAVGRGAVRAILDDPPDRGRGAAKRARRFSWEGQWRHFWLSIF